MPTRRITPNTKEAVGKVLDGEAIIINLVSGAYYSTAGVGATIWQAIEKGWTVRQIVAVVVAEYEVEESVVRLDVDRLLGELSDEHLVSFDDADEAEVHGAVSAATRRPYEPPVLNIYRDMSDLLALDPPMPAFGNPPGEWDGKPTP